MVLHDTPNIITIEHKLLENIQNLLIEQNKILKDLGVFKSIDEVKEVKHESILPSENNAVVCQICGGDHSNVGVRLACARKYKNRGGK
jgi:hypothetical protein